MDDEDLDELIAAYRQAVDVGELMAVTMSDVVVVGFWA